MVSIKHELEVISCLYHLPWSSVPPNHRKGPKWPSAFAYCFAAIGAISLVVFAPAISQILADLKYVA